MKALLIVDDNAAMRQLMRACIDGLSETIYECSNGAEALISYRTYHPDCVLMDWQMPVMDGVAATRCILAEYPSAQVVMVTQHNDALLRKQARKVGFCDFVVKDDLLQLPAVLRRIENSKRTA